ncbi:MAG: FkbM family methyltransferase [Leptolyngbya sp. SIO3F4]|nr:FkbM family methyltransferase [Leptolyngbya sp. SIO3F4]
MNSVVSNLIQSPTFIGVRSFTRKFEIGRKLLQLIASSINGKYEDGFQKVMLDNIQASDTIWDIGANVGFYTEKFLQIIDASGQVVAVEPSPSSAEKCRELAHKNSNLTVIEAAIGSYSGEAHLVIEEESTSPTNHISNSSENSVSVSLMTGDVLLKETKASPNLIKIDVEGFEIDVLKGMPQVLSSPELRSVFVEVHSKLLEENGYRNGPKLIAQILGGAGFQTKWIDFSHIVGLKPY